MPVRHDLYLPFIPASLQTLGRVECAVTSAPAPPDLRTVNPLILTLHNAYIASQVQLGTNTTLCDAIHSVPSAVQASLDNFLSDAAGGALVRLRAPYILVVFNEEMVTLRWTTSSQHASNADASMLLAFRVTQRPSAQAAENDLLCDTPCIMLCCRGRMNTLSPSPCKTGVAIGLSAPAFASVRSVHIGIERQGWRGGKGHDGHTGMIYNRAQGEVRKPKCQRTEG